MLGRVNTLEQENNRIKEEIKNKRLQMAKDNDMHVITDDVSLFEKSKISYIKIRNI